MAAAMYASISYNNCKRTPMGNQTASGGSVSLRLCIMICLSYVSSVNATGYRLVGSSGCTAQMVFLPPYANTAVFIDKYGSWCVPGISSDRASLHANYGGPGYNMSTGLHSSIAYTYANTNVPVFGTEFDLATSTIRALKPLSNTFCSAGAFFPNGTLLNMAGAESGVNVLEGFDKLRFYAPGPCANGTCSQDWVERGKLQVYRWYPSALTTVKGDILVVGGSNVGGLVLNEASINVPTYEIVHADGRVPLSPVNLPILNFTTAQNLVPGKSYNLYPLLFAMPNAAGTDQIFTIAGNQTIIWDYSNNTLVTTLPDTPHAPRTFPSSATAVLLPLRYPDYAPTILVCGGSSGDMPIPVALADCYTIKPLDASPSWVTEDSMPNGAQVLSDGILLPDGTVLIINGGRRGSGGGYMADAPVYQPLIYNSSAPIGSRFQNQPKTTIPRLYHSVATLLPSGEVLIAGSNPAVDYSLTGGVPSGWPYFKNNGHRCALQQAQFNTSKYPTEYRVEIFSPPYMNFTSRPVITTIPANITYGAAFSISTSAQIMGDVQVVLVSPGFHTHGLGMNQRMVELSAAAVSNSSLWNVMAPPNATVIPPGVYLMFMVLSGTPSEGKWLQLG